MKKTLLVISTLFITATTIFAPAQRFFALNHETKQCAGYWGGDEYVTYELPSQWVIFEYKLQYSKESTSFEVETDIGTCQVPWEGQINSEKSCCSELGYTYTSENIGIRTITTENSTAQDTQAETMRSLFLEQNLSIIIYILIGAVSSLAIITLGLRTYRKKTAK